MSTRAHPASLTAAVLSAAACAALVACGPKSPARPTGPARVVPSAERAVAPTAPSAGTYQVTGTVADAMKPPRPGSVPYKDAIVAVHLTQVASRPAGVPKEIVAYVWGMRDNRLMPSARLQKGQVISVVLKPWDTVEDEYGSYNRIELSDPKALSLAPYWGEMK